MNIETHKTNGEQKRSMPELRSKEEDLVTRLALKNERQRKLIQSLSEEIENLEDRQETTRKAHEDAVTRNRQLSNGLDKAKKEIERLCGRRDFYASLGREAQDELKSTSQELAALRAEVASTPKGVLVFFRFVAKLRSACSAARQVLAT